MMQYAIYTSPTGALFADYSSRARGVSCATNERGYAECKATIAMDLPEMLQLYDFPGLLHVVMRDDATGRVFEGRLEDIKIEDGGITLGAFGYARALSDLTYTALWSTTQYSDFVPVYTYSGGLSTPNRPYAVTKNDAGMSVGLLKNQIYTSNYRGEHRYTPPSGGSRTMAAVAFEWQFYASTNITFRVSTYSAAGAFVADLLSVVGTGALQGGAGVLAFSASTLAFGLEATTGHTFAGEDGSEFLNINNLRIVTSTANMVNTTSGTAVGAAPGFGTITPASMANIGVGHRLYYGGGAGGEVVTVTAITSTTFTAFFTKNHASGVAIQAFPIYADTIAKDLVTATNLTNPTQIAPDTALIQSPGVDLFEVNYADEYGADILDRLVRLGDTVGRIWEWGVLDDRALYFRPQYAAARSWYTDTRALNIDRTLDNLANSVYAVYQDSEGDDVRSATSTDTISVAQYGVTRRRVIDAKTTSAAEAGVQIAAALADGKDIQPRSGMDITAIYDAVGNRYSLTDVRAGDLITVRNLPPNLSAAIDRVRTFRISRAEYDADTDTLTVEPGAPLPLLEVLLARAFKG